MLYGEGETRRCAHGPNDSSPVHKTPGGSKLESAATPRTLGGGLKQATLSVMTMIQGSRCPLWRPAALMYSFKICLEQMMHWHFVLLAAFFMESQPTARPIMIVIVDFEFQYRAHSGERVEHCGDQRPVRSGHRILCTDEMRRCSGNKRGRIPVVNYGVIE
jgi:hypothetical protein